MIDSGEQSDALLTFGNNPGPAVSVVRTCVHRPPQGRGRSDGASRLRARQVPDCGHRAGSSEAAGGRHTGRAVPSAKHSGSSVPRAGPARPQQLHDRALSHQSHSCRTATTRRGPSPASVTRRGTCSPFAGPCRVAPERHGLVWGPQGLVVASSLRLGLAHGPSGLLPLGLTSQPGACVRARRGGGGCELEAHS